ncbi:YihY/virulence factor BrkB family protein [Salinibacter altiplanensis]|uniref:YihY/virulence factor BrkB family protein n=1 Tax=Salinibacter altiplanensis TaxID=1803181 RepID=UPI000C9FA813|nr:YihY/virulence factor BrkB family protein [Salinibacter altiplanensis]
MPSWFDLPAALRGTLSSVWTGTMYYAVGLYLELSEKNVFLWAQAIAFKVLVTIVPIVILATGIAGRVLQGKDAFTAVTRFIRELLPGSQSQRLIDFLTQLQDASATIVGIGGVGLFLSAMSLFITLRIAVSNAFEQDWHQERSLLRGYLFDVRMVVQVGILFLLSVGLSVSLPSFVSEVIIGQLLGPEQWVQWLWGRAIWMTGLLLPLLLTTAMFFQLYYLVPQPCPRKRSALAGAVLAAVLWESAKQAFTFYATYVGYGTGTEALGSTFGLIVAFVFWVYFSGVVLMIGAVVASLQEHRHVTAGELPGAELPSQLGVSFPGGTGGEDAQEPTGRSGLSVPPARPSQSGPQSSS